MAVLTHDVLLQEFEAGGIEIDPLEENQIGPASIDLTLGDEIRTIQPHPGAIDIVEATDYRDHTEVVSLATPYVLRPGETIHGITKERVRLAPTLCGFLEGRSRYARLGLMIHVTSALVQPGVDNRQVLELSNVSNQPLRVHRNVRVCQLVVMRAEGAAIYRGRFAAQLDV